MVVLRKGVWSDDSLHVGRDQHLAEEIKVTMELMKFVARRS
jgi:hypothetical protein